MGYKELIDSLRKTADEKIQSIWHEAEEESEKIKVKASQKIDRMLEDAGKMQSSRVREITAKILVESDYTARLVRLTAEKILSDHLFSLAASSLHQLRNAEYKDIFGTIARELPPLPWQSIRVNPEDIDFAKEYFPEADIIADENITGGVDAMTEDGQVRVINTFEKRLERVWADILPGLIKDIYKEALNLGTP